MRIVFTSDLHVDAGPLNAAFLEPLAQHAAQLQPDVLIVAGDVCETAAAVEIALGAFRNVGALRLYVPGNHDLYVEPGCTSRDKLDTILPRAAAAAGFESPHLEPVRFAGATFAASPGWWDYSLRDPELDAVVSLEQYRRGIWRGHRAYDRGHVLWPRTDTSAAITPAGAQPAALGGEWAGDEEICDTLVATLDRQLAARRDTNPCIGIVHVLPFDGVAPRHAFGDSAFHDAYLGSLRFGALLAGTPNLSAVVTGHLHRRLDLEQDGIRIVSRPVGRLRSPSADAETLVRGHLGVLAIG